ncbi:MAG: folylpolyglutamate synthase/dihydrofolate synthase family protein [Planctomycetota bacterium]
MATRSSASSRKRSASFDAAAWLSSLANFEQRPTKADGQTPHFGLERIEALCDKLGNPHQTVPAVHVAGTKGKGSTCAMTAAMLRACGHRTGLYTSPHLVDVRERIRVLEPTADAQALPQGEMIGQADFDACIEKVAKAAKAAKVTPTYFDALTAAAFVYFAEQELDIMVVEVGLGGRLDSTNVLTPLVSVITPLSLDHTQQLGPTLSHIAREKAGIIKPGVTAITCLQPDEATLGVLQDVAKERKTHLRVLGEDVEFTWRFEASRMLGRNNRIGFETDRLLFDHLAVPLLGEHQAVNCGLALTAMDELAIRGVEGITSEACAKGLDGLTFDGRLEVIRDEPTVIADAAHNAAGIDALFRAVGQHFTYDASVVIFGCAADKDTDAMLDKLMAGADKVIFCPIDSPRSANPRELQKVYHDAFGRMSQTAGSLQDALRLARGALTDDDLLVITGSFHLVGEAKRILARKAAARDAA